MNEFGLIQPFDIDHGELDGLPLNECFVLGYEFALVVETLKKPDRFCQPVHARNQDRIAKACKASGRQWSLKWMAADVSEDWLQLTIDGMAETGRRCPSCGREL